MPLVAGIDCSTQSTKVLVVDADTGDVVATGRAPHTVTGVGGARETDPGVWWQALRAALGRTGLAGEIAALARIAEVLDASDALNRLGSGSA